jgi:hypothetical membrane protein
VTAWPSFDQTRNGAARSTTKLKMISTRVGIVLFVLAVAAGPLYTVPGYSAVGNLISELAAQNTPRNILMSGAFVALGVGIAVDGLRPFAAAQAPIIGFGVFMALAGLFGHRPISAGVPYVEWAHAAHSALATAAGTSITVAFVWQAVRQPWWVRRAVAAALAVLCLVLPLTMLSFPAVQGAVQRLMYLLMFTWLWLHYPRSTHGT